MVTNLLKKIELNMNAIMKQIAIAIQTRVQNVLLKKFLWNKNYFLGENPKEKR